MKFSIEKQAFLKVLQKMQGIVEKRNTMPILANVLIEAIGSRIKVMATDLEVFIRDSTEATVSEEGSVTVNARKLFEIVKELPSEGLDFTSGKDDKVVIKAAKSRFNIMGLPSKDFPAFPSVDDALLAPVDGVSLKEMIERTSFAVSTDETRYNINGFLLENGPEGLKMVATDGHRLALVEKKELRASAEKEGALLPRKGVLEMKRLLDDGVEAEGSVELGINQKSAVMRKGDTVIHVRLLEGEFPDYRKVIPKDNDKRVTAGRGELLSSLKRVTILSSDKIKGVRFNFSPSRLVLTTSSPDLGDATEEMDINYGGTEIEIAFNARYLIDVLEVLGDEKVSLDLKDQLSPGIVRPEGSEDYTYIIMPMRL